MASTRRLAAILAADVAGYSRLMGADEEGTHERLKAHVRELVDPKIEEHRGRIVKNTGDGMLVEFSSVVDALRCATEVQAGMTARNAALSPDKRIEFRIGIHQGDVATGKLKIAFEDMGQKELKNIARPVRVYAWHPEGQAGLQTARVSSTVSGSPPGIAPRLSIVVLPFTNLSNDPEQQYFADGITEDLTTDLSRIENMFVISCNTAFTYRNKRIDTKQIGRELGVRYVLEGSVRRSGDQVRVSAQLIDAATDAHLWAERFNANADDLLVPQNEITTRIANALGAELSSQRPTERPSIRTRSTISFADAPQTSDRNRAMSMQR